MSAPNVSDLASPSLMYGIAIGGAVLSAVFSCGTYSSAQKTAFLVSVAVGSIFCLLLRISIARLDSDEKTREVMVGLPVILFGYAAPLMAGGQLLILSILSSVAPSLLRSTIQDISWRRVAVLGGLSLGYSVVNAAYEGYQYYHS